MADAAPTQDHSRSTEATVSELFRRFEQENDKRLTGAERMTLGDALAILRRHPAG